jgi:hypothetical protein
MHHKARIVFFFVVTVGIALAFSHSDNRPHPQPFTQQPGIHANPPTLPIGR